MSKSVVIKQNQGFLSTLPIGSIIAWHRDLLGENEYKPELPPGWVRCDGQILDDKESPFNGCQIPNLNGNPDANAANSPDLDSKETLSF